MRPAQGEGPAAPRPREGRITAGARRGRDAAEGRRRPVGGTLLQRAKLVPQPQEAVALGLWILNDWPMRSSTKSISDPRM